MDDYKDDSPLMTWMGDHIFGKRSQAITAPDGGPVEIKGVSISIRKK